MLELWDVYNMDRIKTGETIAREVVLPEGIFHLIVHVCIFNSKGEMLIQQRQPFKQGWPNMWDVTVVGSATSGDSSQSAAERELFEEIGCRLDISHVRPHLTINFESGFDDYYLIERDVDIQTLQLQYEEVQAVKWATKEEILLLIKEGSFIPYHKDLISLLFEIRFKYSPHVK